MTELGPDGRSARRVSTKDKILRAAVALMSENGYTSTSIDDVALMAGVAKGSVFYNFHTKAALGAEVVRRCSEAIADAVRAAVVGQQEGWEALEAATLAVVRLVDASPAEAQVVINELFRPGRPWDAERREIRTALVAPLAEVLRGVHEERLASGLTRKISMEHREMVAVTLLGALIVASLDRAVFTPERSVEDVHRALLETISGLRGTPLD